MSAVAPYAPITVLREDPEGTILIVRAPDGKLVGLLEPRDELPRSPTTSDELLFAPRAVVGALTGRRALVDPTPAVRANALLAEGRLPPAFAARLMLDVLLSLARAHDHGQRVTVRPDRILVDATGHARVVTLGGDEDTMLAAALRFAAPEELEHATDPRGDLWSAGVLFWEAFVGAPLFADHGWALVLAIRERRLPRLGEVRSELAALQPFLDRLLTRDPALRFGSAREAAAAWIDAASGADGIASLDSFQVLVESRCGHALAQQEAALLEASRVPLELPPDEVRTLVVRAPRAKEREAASRSSLRSTPTLRSSRSRSAERSVSTVSWALPAPRVDPMLVRIALAAFALAFVLGVLLRHGS